MNSKLIATILTACISTSVFAQNSASGLTLDVEAQGTAATGDYAPLWLSSNRYGMGGVKNLNGYERVSVMRNEQNDSTRNWRLGYGLDVAVQEGSTSTFFVQQAFASIAYKKARLTVGSKEIPLDIKNLELTSGDLSMGINAHPIPQIRLDINYFSIPFTQQWWKWKISGAYGMTTDGNWQESFSAGTTNRYTNNHLYHEKRIYWKFGKEDFEKFPLTAEVGIRMATQFGGTTYHARGRNVYDETVKHSSDFNAFWHATTWGGSDETDGTEKNVAGNQLGSYMIALTWTNKDWYVKAYAERYFEDQSMITFQYGVLDHMIGLEGKLPKNKFVSNIVVEQMSTRDQSGAVYHDQSANIPDKMNGRDNYYNHNLYSGWQHWGMGIGNPLLTSPIYNEKGHPSAIYETKGNVFFFNNRIKAWHIGLSGDPREDIHWRMLLSFTENWGTYDFPYKKKELQQYCMAEVTYSPEWAKGWSGKLAVAYDHGGVIGNSFGSQITVHKSFNLVK